MGTCGSQHARNCKKKEAAAMGNSVSPMLCKPTGLPVSCLEFHVMFFPVYRHPPQLTATADLNTSSRYLNFFHQPVSLAPRSGTFPVCVRPLPADSARQAPKQRVQQPAAGLLRVAPVGAEGAPLLRELYPAIQCHSQASALNASTISSNDLPLPLVATEPARIKEELRFD